MDRSQPFDLALVKDRAIALARELGAAAVRVAAASPDVRTRDAMRAAFARDDLATWSYDESYAQRASDPEHVLPGARAVICVAMPYATPPPDREPLQGRVSNYAWSADYHYRLRSLLGAVAELIDELAGRPVTAIACDTKPLAERAFAARSGLGWVGKHTNLISPESGSFVFLGEVVTTLDLPVDSPLRKSCGSCARCVSACPTGALRGDYTIDATRCIADLNQRTDAIPRAMRPLVGDWVWGCDLCQLACPPTQRAAASPDAANRPHSPASATPQLLELLRLRSSTFKRTYAPTAMGWRGAAVLRRNAAVALGNALDRSTVTALARALDSDPHPLVRGHAAWALGRIGSPPALDALRRRARIEPAPDVREEIESALEPYERPGR